MTNREIVKELTGEDAEDIFGGDCDNEMEELNENPDDVVGVGDEKLNDEEATEMAVDALRAEIRQNGLTAGVTHVLGLAEALNAQFNKPWGTGSAIREYPVGSYLKSIGL